MVACADHAAAKCGQEADTVFARIARQGMPDDLSYGCEQIDLADELIAGGSRGNLPWPAGNQRDTQPTFEEVGLVAAERPVGMVSVCGQLVELRLRRTAVVACKQDERLVSELVPIECARISPTAQSVCHDEIGVGINTASPLPLGRGQDRRVRRGQRDIQEERPTLASLRCLFANVLSRPAASMTAARRRRRIGAVGPLRVRRCGVRSCISGKSRSSVGNDATRSFSMNVYGTMSSDALMPK